MRKLVLFFLLALMACVGLAQQRTLRVSSFPSAAVADGRSAVAITAEVRDLNGALAPNGTRILFTTTLGTFQESIVTTSNGLARAILVAGNISGTAKITATEIGGQSSPTVFEFDFVSDKAQLSAALEYISIFSDNYLEISPQQRLVAASSAGEVTLRYRDIEIKSPDLQFDMSSLTVRARKAVVKYKGFEQKFNSVYFQLKSRKGFGITDYIGTKPEYVLRFPRSKVGIEERLDGKFAISKPRKIIGLVGVDRTGLIRLPSEYDQSQLDFADLGEATGTITAKAVTIFPGRRLLLTNAEIRLNGQKVFVFPLYEFNLNAPAGALLSENIINLNDSQLGVNYPYFLGLGPGQTSLARFRTGQAIGRGVNVNRGVFLDYEVNWNKGDDQQGGITWSGVGRDDYGLGFRQFNRIDSRTSTTLQLDAPAGQALFGAGTITQQGGGLNWSLNLNGNTNLTGLRNQAQTVAFVGETNPYPVKGTPLRLYYGVRADNTKRSFDTIQIDQQGDTTVETTIRDSQTIQSYGFQVRGVTDLVRLSKADNLQFGFNLRQQAGTNVLSPLAFNAQTTLNSRVTKDLSNILTFDFTRDPLLEPAIGRYRLTTQAFYNKYQKATVSVFAAKSLDINRSNFFGDFSYSFHPRWRVAYTYTLDQSDSGTFTDYNAVLGLQIPTLKIELGLLYSARTQRLGFQLLNTSF